MTETQKKHAKFSSRHVSALAELSIDCDRLFGNNKYIGIQVEPVPDGGVVLSATNGSVLVWVNDPAGKASDMIVIDPCDEFVKATKDAEVRELYTAEGQIVVTRPPPWQMPGNVYVFTDPDGATHSRMQMSPAGKGFDLIMVEPEGQPPGVTGDDGVTLFKSSGRLFKGTQTIKRDRLDWHKVLPDGDPAPTPQIDLSARNLLFLAKFGPAMRFRLYGERKCVLVDFDNDPNVHAAIMPCDPEKFSTEAAAESEGTAQ